MMGVLCMTSLLAPLRIGGGKALAAPFASPPPGGRGIEGEVSPC